jgi:hypothetical protein
LAWVQLADLRLASVPLVPLDLPQHWRVRAVSLKVAPAWWVIRLPVRRLTRILAPLALVLRPKRLRQRLLLLLPLLSTSLPLLARLEARRHWRTGLLRIRARLLRLLVFLQQLCWGHWHR